MSAKVLIVEDDPAWSKLVLTILSKNGYEAEVAENADTAVAKLRQALPDVVILDVTLGGISGFDLCQMIRANPETAATRIMMLTGRKEVKDKVKGLTLGADDYLAKPFDREELLARMNALLRRPPSKSAPSAVAERLSGKNILVDLDRHEVLIKGKPLDLRRKEFELLALFLKNKGRLLKSEFIAESIWGKDFFTVKQTIAQHIKNLRAKLGPLSKSIETVETLGYRYNEEP